MVTFVCDNPSFPAYCTKNYRLVVQSNANATSDFKQTAAVRRSTVNGSHKRSG